MMIITLLSDLTLTDLKVGENNIIKEQAIYNAEIGSLDASFRFNKLSYSGFRTAIYYLNFNSDTQQFSETLPNCDNYAKVKISYVDMDGDRIYTSDVIGNFRGSSREYVKKFIQ